MIYHIRVHSDNRSKSAPIHFIQKNYMNKDAILATVIGMFLGLAIAGIFLAAPTLATLFRGITLPKFALAPTSSTTTDLNTLGKTTETVTATFTIESPIPESIESSAEVLISGNAPVKSIVMLEGLVDETVTVSNDQGNYAGKVTLTEGQNQIVVTNYVAGKEESKTVDVYFTPQAL